MQKEIYRNFNIKKTMLSIALWSWLLIIVYPALYGLFLIVFSFIFIEYQNAFTEGCFFFIFFGLILLILFLFLFFYRKNKECINQIFINNDRLILKTKKGLFGKSVKSIFIIDKIKNIDAIIDTCAGYRGVTIYCLKLKIEDDNDILFEKSFYNGLYALISLIENIKFLPKLNYKFANDNCYIQKLIREIEKNEQDGTPIKICPPFITVCISSILILFLLIVVGFVLYIEITKFCIIF